MTAEPQNKQCATRRGVLLGAGLAGLGGALAGCSTAAVPYGANEAGVVEPGTPAASAMATAAGPMSARPMPASPMPASPMPSSPMPASTRPANAKAKPAHRREAATEPSPAKKDAMGSTATGTVLAAASEIPVGGGKIFTAAKVVVTQPVSGQYLGFSAVCTHVGCIVNEVANGTIDCPCHGSEFKITTGAVVTGPAPSPLPKKQIKIVNGQVVLV